MTKSEAPLDVPFKGEPVTVELNNLRGNRDDLGVLRPERPGVKNPPYGELTVRRRKQNFHEDR